MSREGSTGTDTCSRTTARDKKVAGSVGSAVAWFWTGWSKPATMTATSRDLMGKRCIQLEAVDPGAVPAGSSESPGLRVLDIDTVRELWSRTYNTSGKPDWSHLYPYYHPDVVFQDTIQRIEGIKEFVALCERLTKRCESIQMEILSIAQNSNIILMDWIMTMAFTKYPPTPLYGSTKLTLHEDGRIIAQRDYFDLWGDIINGIPLLKKRYRSFIRRVFG